MTIDTNSDLATQSIISNLVDSSIARIELFLLFSMVQLNKNHK